MPPETEISLKSPARGGENATELRPRSLHAKLIAGVLERYPGSRTRKFRESVRKAVFEHFQDEFEIESCLCGMLELASPCGHETFVPDYERAKPAIIDIVGLDDRALGIVPDAYLITSDDDEGVVTITVFECWDTHFIPEHKLDILAELWFLLDSFNDNIRLQLILVDPLGCESRVCLPSAWYQQLNIERYGDRPGRPRLMARIREIATPVGDGVSQ